MRGSADQSHVAVVLAKDGRNSIFPPVELAYERIRFRTNYKDYGLDARTVTQLGTSELLPSEVEVGFQPKLGEPQFKLPMWLPRPFRRGRGYTTPGTTSWVSPEGMGEEMASVEVEGSRVLSGCRLGRGFTDGCHSQFSLTGRRAQGGLGAWSYGCWSGN